MDFHFWVMEKSWKFGVEEEEAPWSPNFLQAWCPYCRPINSVKTQKGCLLMLCRMWSPNTIMLVLSRCCSLTLRVAVALFNCPCIADVAGVFVARPISPTHFHVRKSLVSALRLKNDIWKNAGEMVLCLLPYFILCPLEYCHISFHDSVQCFDTVGLATGRTSGV